MSAATEPTAPPGAFARGRQAFRRWRRGRPFWGGLVTILSGVFYYLSVHLDPTSIAVSFGQNGFLAWLIPLIMVLCGLLAWFSPAQRIFYGVVAAATAVYGLIAVNLGGFGFGLITGMIGGSLVAAWSVLGGSPARGTAPGAGDAGDEPADPDWAAASQRDDATTDDLLSGPLSDELPASPVVPPAQADGPRHQAQTPRQRSWWPGGNGNAGTGSGPTGDAAVEGERDTRRPYVGGAGTLALLPILLLAVGLATVPDATRASAAPTCTPTSTAPSAPRSSAPVSAPSTSAPAAPATTATPDSNPVTGLVGGIVNGLASLLGGGKQAGTATPSPSAPAAGGVATTSSSAPVVAPSKTKAKPTPTAKASCTPKPTKSTAAAAPGGPIVMIAPAPGQVPVAGAPAILITATLQMSGLSYDGVVELPTKNGGTVRVLQFSMSSAVQTPFELDLPVQGGSRVVQTADKLTISGNVKFYCTKFSGTLIGLLPLTFTPDSPPPLVLSEMTFTKAEIELVYVHADKLVAPNFGAH